MKLKYILPFFLLLFPVFANGQSPCDNLNLISIGYSPFTDSLIIVSVENNNQSEIFDYPGFVLINSLGDTVAKEQVHYFGISGQSVHSLQVLPDIHNPLEDFVGDLQLYSGFYEDFECEWSLNESLCTINECDSIVIAFENYGGALVLGDFAWSVLDSTENTLESGTFTMEAQEQRWEKRLCLPKGIYSYTLTALGQPSGGGPTLTASTLPSYLAPIIQVHLDWFNQPTATLEIPIYVHCIAQQEPNGIESVDSQSAINVITNGSHTLIQHTEVIQSVTMFSGDGRVVEQFNPNKTEFVLPSALKSGFYLISVETDAGLQSVKVKL